MPRPPPAALGRARHHLAHLGAARLHGRQLLEGVVGLLRDQPRDRRLARARRPEQDHRVRRALLDRRAQRRALAEQVLLADDLVERLRPHPRGQRRVRRDGRRAAVGLGQVEELVAHLGSVTRVEDLQQETADVLGRADPLQHGQPAGRRARRGGVAGATTCATPAWRRSSTAPSPSGPTWSPRSAIRTTAGRCSATSATLDTVLADPDAWSRDPWGGDSHDGFVWGRGAIDMKSQVAAEAVAAAHLARRGWRPERGALKVFAVADEETGGALGAQWLTQNRPDLARCDFLLNEGAGTVMPYGDRRLYGVCCAEKGTFRFRVTAPRAAPATPPSPRSPTTRCSSWPRCSRGSPTPTCRSTSPTRPAACCTASARTPTTRPPRSRASRETEPRIAALVERQPAVTVAADDDLRLGEDQRDPRRAELRVDCRAPAGMDADAVHGAPRARARRRASS